MLHHYQNNGYDIIIDGNSGAIHSVDAVAAFLILAYESGDADAAIAATILSHPEVSEEELRELAGDIDILRAEGKLYSEPFEDAVPRIKESSSVKALCLHVAHACNMTCEYCFAGQGRFSGEAALMSYETGKAALDWLVANSVGRRNLEVDFFGGEPLLNFDVVKRLVSYARSLEAAVGKNFRFTLTTNGLLLDDDATDFLNRECHNVVLSLDGRREINDRFRRTPDGRGSYDRIVPNFKRFVERRLSGDLFTSYYMRGTFTADNLDFSSDILHMADLGFNELSMEPVVSAPDAPHAIKESDLPRIYREYDDLAAEMVRRERGGRPITFYHYILDLEGGPCASKRLAGCGSGSEYFAVTPSGDLYPCHQFVGDPAYKMGNVYSGVTKSELRERFSHSCYTDKLECRKCFARLFCAGGCAANAYHATGDIGGVYKIGCDIFRHRIECAIMLAVARENTKRKEN